MSVTFSYPTTSPTHSVTLRNPELGDGLTVDIKTKFRRAMNGDMHSFKSTPSVTILSLQFSGIVDALMTDLIDLFKASAGSQIKYVDQDSNVWFGYITNNPLDTATQRTIYANEGDSSDCLEDFEFAIDFEGTKQ